ncbi:MAG TPA: hypothetical protein PL020_00720, partial [Candidatus Cloacimonadota bacterium]|nr:hypothetical protein [Candidatus Cloacimonadota bacterium]
MSTTTKTLLIIFAVIILLIGMSWCTGKQLGKYASVQNKAILSDNSWLSINPSGILAEYNEVLPMAFMGKSMSNSVQNLSAKIRH